MLFICTYSLLVSIFENAGYGTFAFPSVIAFLASSKERYCRYRLFANSFANINLSNKPASLSAVLKNNVCKRSTIINFHN
jgi:hypothetical protein